jgi:2,4-dienoyl-CoA reductase-like NADH-dependent reductase (Old Yellow Enzyme family)
MIDPLYFGNPKDTAIIPAVRSKSDEGAAVAAWTTMAQHIKAHGSVAIMQINHPGRQSPPGAGSRGLLTKNVAPSAIPLDFGSDLLTTTVVKLMFGKPAEMTLQQIETLISSFVNAAKVAHQAGFDGVEIHAAHGYLLSDFMSAKVNQRTDKYGGTAEKRVAVIVEIIRAIRSEGWKGFCVSVKLNSADQQNDVQMNDVLKQVSLLAAEDVDFIEISGGSYENPQVNILPPLIDRG